MVDGESLNAAPVMVTKICEQRRLHGQHPGSRSRGSSRRTERHQDRTRSDRFAIGTAVSIGLGVYGRLHTPSGHAVNIAGFSSGAAAKAALASVVMGLAIVQIVTAMGIYGRFPLRGAWVGTVHRWSGRLAVLISVPVAVHCLYALLSRPLMAESSRTRYSGVSLRSLCLQDVDLDPR